MAVVVVTVLFFATRAAVLGEELLEEVELDELVNGVGVVEVFALNAPRHKQIVRKTESPNLFMLTSLRS